MTGQLNQDLHSLIQFKNPYPHPINIQVYVEGDESEAFSLLGKNGNMVALASSTNNLTFCFCPQEIKEYKAVFVVKMSDQISWKYPILGISEM